MIKIRYTAYRYHRGYECVDEATLYFDEWHYNKFKDDLGLK